MRVLLLGRIGQVGWELRRTLLPVAEVIAIDRDEVDLSRTGPIAPLVREHAPDVIVNAIAYTAVDQAESEPELAYALNARAPEALAKAAAERGALLVHYSTDYVFDGTKRSPYDEDDRPNPLGVYGASKLAGDEAVAGSGADYLIFRTSWVYAARGKNFVRTMLRLAQEREELRVVADQIGAPTWARFIAEATALALHRAVEDRRAGAFESGTFNLTSAGETNWHGFTQAILEEARKVSPALPIKAARVLPIATSEYPTPAKRPANSRLSCDKLRHRFGITVPDWRTSLVLCLGEMLEER